MSLKDWVRNGWLTEHKTSSQEITDLFRVADRDLTDCQAEGLSPDWHLNIAYNAALQLATATLAASGYRSAREAHHYRVIQSLGFTIELDKGLIQKLDQFRKKRNLSDYERAGLVSEQEADEMETLARDLRKKVEAWLKTNQPHLLKGR